MVIEPLYISDFEKIYKIMEDSFPKSEFRPYNEQLALFDNTNYSILGIKNGLDIVSIAAIWEFDEIIFIEHLATSPEYRGHRLGATILQKIITSTDKTVCLEVEPPIDDLTRRRVAFYERNGFNFNSFPYLQPSITKGQKSIPLFIMTSKSKIDENKLNKIKKILYTSVYKTDV